MRLRSGALVASLALLFTASGARANGPRVDLARAEIVGNDARAPSASGPVRLTLDLRLQRSARALLASARAHEAALVASDVRTGRILAWVSLGSHRDLVSTAFAPGASVFKIATATALLERGISPATRQCYRGGEHGIEEADLRDDPAHDEACATFGDALGHSINLVFARLALKYLAPPALRERASLLGLEGPVPIDVDASPSTATIPDDPLGLARAAAGFWNGKLTPLGALFAVQTVANRGERVRLHVLETTGADARAVDGRAMSEATASALRRMLEVTTRRGTCARAFRHADGTVALPNVTVAAKTGTLIGGQPTRMYSWFTGFAPSNRPEIAVTVLLANDVSWWSKANAVARAFLETYFEGAPYEARPHGIRASVASRR